MKYEWDLAALLKFRMWYMTLGLLMYYRIFWKVYHYSYLLFMLQNSHLTSFHADHEGKAGMASLILKHNASLDLEQMYKQVVTYLPSYACPLFLRIQVSCIIIALCIQTSTSFKHKIAKWITKSACLCITRLVLDLVLFVVSINGILEKGLHKKSVNLQIMFKWEKLYKWARTEITQKDLGRLET